MSRMENRQGKEYKLYQESFHHDIRQVFFTVKIIFQWNDLPRDMVESLLLEVFKIQLDRMLENLI